MTEAGRMATLLLHHDAFSAHRVPPGHPERPERIAAVMNALAAADFAALAREEAPEADLSEAERVHDRGYVAAIQDAIPEAGLARLDPDTVASPGSLEAVLRAIGGLNRAVDAVFAGTHANAFVACRPPGHHAETRRAMGFCLFDTVAVAARYAQAKHGAERVAIVDFDVHHGNGTQEIFWTDPSVLYASTHQMPLFPGTGALSETGAGNIHNAPLAPGDDGRVFRQAFETRILPALDAFQPDLVVVSAGFDAHHRDPLGSLRLTEEDFSWATGKLMDVADAHAGGRLVSALEGGYDLDGLARSVAAHVTRLMRG